VNSSSITTSISSSESWCWSLPASISCCGSWLFCGGCCDDEGCKSATAVWGPSGLLTSMAATWDSVEVCGSWLLCGMWVDRTVASMVLWS
jgi:hypothetical protein